MAVEQLCQLADVVGAWPAFTLLPATEQVSLINTASRKILNFCRRERFDQQYFLERKDGKNLPRLWLNVRPVIIVKLVRINGWLLGDVGGRFQHNCHDWWRGQFPDDFRRHGDFIEFRDAYHWRPKTGELVRGNGQDATRFAPWFPAGVGNIHVEYWAGFDGIPEPINRAAIFYVRWLAERSAISGIYSSERIGDWSGTLAANATSMTLPSHVADLCADYVQDDGPL
jgi:hypothetical protein